MRIDVDLYRPRVEVIVRHTSTDGVQREVNFLANFFTSKPFMQGYDVFKYINDYWSTLPIKIQDEIYQVYERVYEYFTSITNEDELFTSLNNEVKLLVQYHPLDHLNLWLQMNPSIMTPESVLDQPPDITDSVKTADKTYTKRSYFELLALSLFLKTMVPIWGEYVSSIKKTSEVDKKEYIAIQLFDDTGIMETAAIKRLELYIKAISNDTEEGNFEDILNGFSTEDIVFKLLSLICMKRLCLADLDGTNQHRQIIAVVYKFLAQRLYNQLETDIIIKKEDLSDGPGNDSGKRSIIESYRRRTEISVGELAEIEYAIDNVFAIAHRLAPTISEFEVQASVNTAMALESEWIGNIQLVLAGWMIKNQITPRAPYYINKRYLCKLLGALEAVLWHRNQRYMACVITSAMITGTKEIAISNISSREQIDKETVAKLQKFYPYEWVHGKHRRGNQVSVVSSIDYAADDLIFNAWKTTIAEEKLVQVFDSNKRKLVIYPNIKTQLANLIIENETYLTEGVHDV